MTLAFWKPYDVLCKFTDDDGRATLADYIDQPGFYSAGRLDRDSEGLLLLSDAPKMRGLLTNHRHSPPRTYLAQVERVPAPEAVDALRGGVAIKGGTTQPCQVGVVAGEPDLPARSVPIRVRKTVPTAWLRLTLNEGKNRQVRRMTAAVGHPTLRLVRVAIGPVTLAGIEPGSWRTLAPDEERGLLDSSHR